MTLCPTCAPRGRCDNPQICMAEAPGAVQIRKENGMPYNSTTTLNRIRNALPCRAGWSKLLAHLGKTTADDEPLPLLTVLNSNGLDDTIWVLSYAMPDARLARHFKAQCAEQVLHLFEAKRPDDTRVRDQIAMLRNDDATPAARLAAWRDAKFAHMEARGIAAIAASAAVHGAVWYAAEAARRAYKAAAAQGVILGASWRDAWNAQERQLRAMIGELT